MKAKRQYVRRLPHEKAKIVREYMRAAKKGEGRSVLEKHGIGASHIHAWKQALGV